MKYAIMVRERGSDRLVELCQVASNPTAIEEAARSKMMMIDQSGTGRRSRVPKYEHVEIRELA